MLVVINPKDEPIRNGESWWIVHPNDGYLELDIPSGAYTLCLRPFGIFKVNIVYQIIGDDSKNGWVSLLAGETVYKMPYYVFARYFDFQAFLRKRNITTKNFERFEDEVLL